MTELDQWTEAVTWALAEADAMVDIPGARGGMWTSYRDGARAAVLALAPLVIERCAAGADLPKKDEPIEVPDGVFERIAHADAMYDRRDWMGMSKADRDRYVARVKATLGVVISVFIETRMLGDAPSAIRALKTAIAEVGRGKEG